MTEELEVETFISQQREWLLDHMKAHGLSWPVISKRIDVKSGTLSVFGGNKYLGDNEKIARKIKEHRDFLEDQADLDDMVAEVPDYFETPTSNAMIQQLRWAHRGKMVAIAGISGIGKTSAIFYYRDANPTSVIYIKIRPSNAGLATMLLAVLRALGKKNEVGSPQRLSDLVIDIISERKMLLVFDEAHFLSDPAFEEIRVWNDIVPGGVGIAFVGEPKLVQRIRATGRQAKTALARRTVIFELARVKSGDVEAQCNAWGSNDPDEINLMRLVAKQEGALGECSQVFELASMVAAGRGEPRTIDHLLRACKQRGLDFRHVQDAA